MTFARLLLEIRRRAASLPQDVPRAAALRQAVQEAISRSADAEPARTILAVLVGARNDAGLDASVLDRLTPEAVLQLDLVAAEMIDYGRQTEAMQVIQDALNRAAR